MVADKYGSHEIELGIARAYASLDPQERLEADRCLCQALDGDDRERFTAQSIIRRYVILSAIPHLHSLDARLSLDGSAPARGEREKLSLLITFLLLARDYPSLSDEERPIVDARIANMLTSPMYAERAGARDLIRRFHIVGTLPVLEEICQRPSDKGSGMTTLDCEQIQRLISDLKGW